MTPTPAGQEPLLAIDQLTVTRGTGSQVQEILTRISLQVAEGEAIGIVGESGSGKSVTARATIGLLSPSLSVSGAIRYRGNNLLAGDEQAWRKVRGSEIGMVLQDPFTMLNPVIKSGRILTESLPRQGRRLSRQERSAQAVERLAEVGIHDPNVVERYPFQLSGGMRQRLAIAAALASDPRLLIADEPSTALDVTTQRETLGLIKRLQRNRGMSLVLITHDLRVAFNMCDRVYVMYAGSIVEHARSEQFDTAALHPYTHGLLLSEPPIEYRVRELVTIGGSVPGPGQATDRCSFADRCEWVAPICLDKRPPLADLGHGRSSACVRIGEIGAELAAIESSATRAGLTKETLRPPTLVSITDVVKTFSGQRGRSKTAVDKVSLTIGEGECVGLVGESGSGKTTLARMLAGLEQANGGSISIGGIDVSHWDQLSKSAKRTLRGTVQVVFQDPYSTLNPALRIGTVLTEAVLAHSPGQRDVRQRVVELLSTVGLPAEVTGQRPAALSGGMRQRVAIARALAADPKFLICDEPVSALDVSVQAQILNLLRRLHNERGLGYLFITHDLAVVRQVSDYLYVMRLGQIVEHGPTETVLNAPHHPYSRQLLDSVPRKDGWLDLAETGTTTMDKRTTA